MKAMNFKPFENRIYLSSPTMHGDEMKYILEAYESNWMSTVGENINEAEKLCREFVGMEHAVALTTVTSALHMAVKLAAVKKGQGSRQRHHLCRNRQSHCLRGSSPRTHRLRERNLEYGPRCSRESI